MSEITKEEYMDLLQGKSRGKAFSKDCYTIKRVAKKVTDEKQILTGTNVGLPSTLNDEYDAPSVKKKKKLKLDPRVLQMLADQ